MVVKAVEATGAEMADTTDAATEVETAVTIERKRYVHSKKHWIVTSLLAFETIVLSLLMY